MPLPPQKEVGVLARSEKPKVATEPYVAVDHGPKPRARLLRTFLRRPRPVRQFAPRISFDPISDTPSLEIAAHWGEYVLIEDIVTVLHRDGTLSAIRHIVTQLHSAEAMTQWDELIRNWDTGCEAICNLHARLFLPDGNVRNAIKRQQAIAVADSRPNQRGRTLRITFAPLRPGVILEFEEQYDSFRPDELGPFMWNDFLLTTRVPAGRRRITAVVAQPFKLAYRVHHIDMQPEERMHKEYKIYTWDQSDVGGFEYDGWTPPVRDFVPWLDISTASSWAPFARKLRKELEPAWSSRDVRELAVHLAADAATERDKSIAAYEYAAQNVRYGRPPAETEVRNIRPGAQMIEDLRGDCKDKSALLVQLLRSMHLQANVAVVLTADSGRTPFLPSTRFNHALVRLKLADQVVWLDAASGPFGFGELPSTDQDIRALVLHREGFEFDHLPVRNDERTTESREINGRLLKDGSYSFHASIRFRGDLAARLRVLLTDRNESHRHEALQLWLGSDYLGAVGSGFEHDRVDDLGNDFGYTCEAQMERVARPLKNLLLLHVPWAGPLAMTGPMSAVVRRQPLTVPLGHYYFERHTMELPESVAIVAAPEPVTHDCEWGSYRCTITPSDGKLICEREFRLYGHMVPGDRFFEFREFWRQSSWSDNSEVVLSVV